MFHIGVIVVLLVSLGYVSGQDTGIGLRTCTYSFVVHSPYCEKQENPDVAADIKKLQDTVERLKTTVTQLTRDVSTLKVQPPPSGINEDDLHYSTVGCQNNKTGVVKYLMISSSQSISEFTMNHTTVSGVRLLVEPFPVFCTEDNYLVFQRRRRPFGVSFNRTWAEYRDGFGEVNGDFWLGLDRLYHITNQPYVRYSLRMEFITKEDGHHKYIEYDNFYIGNEAELFKVKSLGRIIDDNTAGGWMDGNPTFRTWDKDTDRKYGQMFNGFWYTDIFNPQPFNSNPKWGEQLISWTEFKIRPVQK